jgi:hypothetical protein
LVNAREDDLIDARATFAVDSLASALEVNGNLEDLRFFCDEIIPMRRAYLQYEKLSCLTASPIFLTPSLSISHPLRLDSDGAVDAASRVDGMLPECTN